jgi:hypothetical protein
MKMNKVKLVLLPVVATAVISLCLVGCNSSHEHPSDHPKKAPANEHPTEHPTP